ncbi:YhjD/YihY/BrkB family envelope integrity protein [Planctomycetota bacterium]
MIRQTNTSRSRIRQVASFFWSQPRFFVRSLEVLLRNRGAKNTAILSYYSLFALMPTLVALILTLQWIPAYQNLEQQALDGIYSTLGLTDIRIEVDPNSPGSNAQLTAVISQEIQSDLARVDREVLTGIAVGLSLMMALVILASLEHAFNHLWRATGRRGCIRRCIEYWVLFSLGPVLLALDIYLLTSYVATGLLGSLSPWEPYILMLLATLLGLFVLYYVLPKATVQVGPTFWGALIVTGLLSLLTWGCYAYITYVLPAHRVLGLVGLLPLSFLGVYLAWFFVLFGTQLIFTIQHLPEPVVLVIPSDNPKRFMVNDRTIVNVLREVLRHFSRSNQPVPGETILGRLDIPQFYGDKLLALLVDTGYLIRASDPCDGFVPAKRAADIKLADIATLVDQVSFGQKGLDGTPLDVIADEQDCTPIEGTLEDPSEKPKEEPSLWPDQDINT